MLLLLLVLFLLRSQAMLLIHSSLGYGNFRVDYHVEAIKLLFWFWWEFGNEIL